MRTNDDLMTELQSVLRDVFEDDTLVVSAQTTADDVPGWDSLQHVTLVLQVESHFGVRFVSSEVADLKNVGDLRDLIERRLKSPRA